MFMIEVNMSLGQISTWVLDTACGSHICNSLQGLKGSRTLEKDEVILCMGNRARVAAISVGSFSSHMPTGKTIILNNCDYVPSIVRNIVSIPVLDVDGFSFIIKNNECSILRDNVLFGRGILNNGLLGHISENRLRTLHKEGLLDPFDFESYPTSYVKKVDPDKLESRSVKCNFVGYPKETLGYYFYTDHRVLVSRHATFLEKEFILEGNSGSKIELDEVQEAKTTTDQVETPVQTEQPSMERPIRRTGRVSRQPERYYGLIIENDNELSVIDDDNPVTYNEAMSSVDLEKWHSAMKSEMESMYTNQVWTLVKAPEGVKPIGCKWVYKRKIGIDGQVETYKARLVAKGFKQRQWIDFDETFSPVALLKSIRILLAIAAYYDYEIWKMDVKTAFLNRELEEELYMTHQEGFLSKGNEHLVCKLLRTIYGLRQASRRWNIHYDETIKEFGFIKNIDETCVYKKVSGSAITFLVLYVDDILLIGNDIPMLQSVKVWLSKNFTMKDLGEASYILGMKIYRDRSRRMIDITQGTYIQKVLKRFSMENSKRAIRSIMYAMLCTRPDVAYSISVTSRYQSNPEGYTDSSFQSESDRKSMSGYVFTLNGGAIQIVERGDVNVERVDTHNNVADPLAKPLSQSHFDRHKDKMGIRYQSDWL
ncbi:hypothetical protein AgCh_022017 [Apium graveolens]